MYLETGRSNSSQDKRVRDHKKLIHFSKDFIDTMRNIIKLKKIFNQPSKRQNLTIFTINIAGINKLLLFFLYIHKFIHIPFYSFLGDIIELYAMQKESGIYNYCLIEEVTIPLHIISLSTIYPLIHILLTLRTVITCTLHKILYNPDSENSEHSSSEMVVTVSTFKNL
jgi:hypothetical protein